jgi:hypothetical protein
MSISLHLQFIYGYYDPTGVATGLPVTGWDEENDRPEEGPCGCVVDRVVPMGSHLSGVFIYVKGSEVFHLSDRHGTCKYTHPALRLADLPDATAYDAVLAQLVASLPPERRPKEPPGWFLHTCLR